MALNSASNLEVKETATTTWINYLHKPHGSSSFSTPSGKYSFCLSSLEYNNNGDVSISLSNDKKDLSVQCRISILDAYDKKHFTREYKCDFRNSRHASLTADNDYLLKLKYIRQTKFKPMWVNGILTIYCEVDVLNEKPRKRKAPEAELEGSFAKICDDYRALLESGKMSDFVIVVGEKKFQVHKVVLSTRSPVFAAMFEHEDTKEVKEGQLVIRDIRVEVVDELIRYIYCGEIESLDENASDLFVAADMYQLDHLKSICEQSLIASLSTESVCCVFLLADMHNADELKSKCIQFIIKNHDKVMATDEWKKLMDTNRMDLMAELFKISASQDNS